MYEGTQAVCVGTVFPRESASHTRRGIGNTEEIFLFVISRHILMDLCTFHGKCFIEGRNSYVLHNHQFIIKLHKCEYNIENLRSSVTSCCISVNESVHAALLTLLKRFRLLSFSSDSLEKKTLFHREKRTIMEYLAINVFNVN